MRGCALWLGLLVVCVGAAPALRREWLQPPYGNANLLFNMQLVFALAAGSLVAEFASAAQRQARRARQLAKHMTYVGADGSSRPEATKGEHLN